MKQIIIAAIICIALTAYFMPKAHADGWNNGRKWADVSDFEAVITHVGDINTVGFVIVSDDCKPLGVSTRPANVDGSVINGVLVKMTVMCISANHKAYMATTRAGKLYILKQFKAEGEVLIEGGISFTAAGFNNALHSYNNKPEGI